MSAKPTALEAMLATALEAVPDPSKGLPDEVFHFIRKVTPLINVDLLVRNDQGEHLLAWREDEYGRGWHIPGGIIRFNEPIVERIAAVAKHELSAVVEHLPNPVDLRQFFTPRGHFISLLYFCRLRSPVGDPSMWHGAGAPRHGQIRWCKGVPAGLYWVHETFADWLNGRTV